MSKADKKPTPRARAAPTPRSAEPGLITVLAFAIGDLLAEVKRLDELRPDPEVDKLGWNKIDDQVAELLARVNNLEDAIAAVSARTLPEAIMQLGVLRNSIWGKRNAVHYDFMVESIACAIVPAEEMGTVLHPALTESILGEALKRRHFDGDEGAAP